MLLSFLVVILLAIGLVSYNYYFAELGSSENPVKVTILAIPETQSGSLPTFSPSNFTITEGEHVAIEFDNTDSSPHEFEIPTFGLSTGIVSGGQTATMNLVPEKVGTFAYGQPDAHGLITLGNVTVLAP